MKGPEYRARMAERRERDDYQPSDSSDSDEEWTPSMNRKKTKGIMEINLFLSLFFLVFLKTGLRKHTLISFVVAMQLISAFLLSLQRWFSPYYLFFFNITKTSPCNIQQFFTAVKITIFSLIFLCDYFHFFAQNIYCGYTLEPSH